MTRTRIIIAVFVVLAAVVALLWFGSRAPKTLAEAIIARPDEIPESFEVLLPPSEGIRVGTRATPINGATRRAEVKGKPCFLVIPERLQGLKELKVRYTNTGDLGAELSGLLKAKVGDVEEATLTLGGLTVTSGALTPLANAGCEFTNGTSTHRVVTRQIVAESAELNLSLKNNASTELKLGDAEQRAGEEIHATAGWSATSNTNISGKNIVIAGSSADVEVQTAQAEVVLGSTPAAGAHPLPKNLSGSVVVEAYDDGPGILTFRVEAPAYSASDVAGVRLCPAGKSIELKASIECYVMLAPGTAVVVVSWARTPDDKIAMRMVGHLVTAKP